MPRIRPFEETEMPPRPPLSSARAIPRPEWDLGPVRDEWDGRCPDCGGDAELTSYLGTDDMRSEEHWWCAKCMLGLNIRVVRLVAKATSARPDDREGR